MIDQLFTPARLAGNDPSAVAAPRVPDLVRRIGRTPLLRLRRIEEGLGLPDTVSVYAKAEFLNPGGSVKDRPAWRMIQEGLRAGALRPGKRLVDATSGNTGIACAMLGAALGFPVTLAMPANASRARKHIMEAYGAELITTDPMEGTDGAQHYVRRLVARNPDLYFYPDQYNNDANWRAHFEGTGKEILAQTNHRVTHFVAGLGTTGTFVGVSRRLQRAGLPVRRVAVQPASPLHGLEGLKHLETALVPGIYDPTLVDDLLRVGTEEAQAMTRRLAREEGLLVGVSAGANVAAALRVAAGLKEGVVVTVLCDTGMRYLDEPFWQETGA
jgi:cysteine synthase B